MVSYVEYRVVRDRKNESGRVLSKKSIKGTKFGFFDKKGSREAVELFNSLPVMMLVNEEDVKVVFEKPNFFIFNMEISVLKEYVEKVEKKEKMRKEKLEKEKEERENMKLIEKRVKEIEDDPNFQIIPEFKKVSRSYLSLQVKKTLEENGIERRSVMFDEYEWEGHIIKIPYNVIRGSYFKNREEYRITVYPENLSQRISDLEDQIKHGLHREVLKAHNDNRSDRELMFSAGFTLNQEGKNVYWTGDISVGESSDGYRAARVIDQRVGILDAVDKLYPGERNKFTEEAKKELEKLKNQPPLKELVITPIPEGYEVVPDYDWDSELKKALLNGVIS